MMDACEIHIEGRHVVITHSSLVSSSDILTAVLKEYAITDIEVSGPQIDDIVMEVYNS